MSRPWEQKPLWERVWLSGSPVLIEAGKILGHRSLSAVAFYDAAKLLPCYDKFRFESAVRDLCGYAAKEKGTYELTPQAKKVLRVVIGPAPDSPEYRTWWEARLVSVAMLRKEGTEPTHCVEPPVPIPDMKRPTVPVKKPPAKKETRKPPAKKPRKAG